MTVGLWTLFNLIFAHASINGVSMQPTLTQDQNLLISRVHYLFGDIQYGDIIVFRPPEGRGERRLVKRVIGLPGDEITMDDNRVYVNGAALDEPYWADANRPCRTCRNDYTWVIGSDEYFLMGDNRNESTDSRSFGAIPRDRIVGKVILRYYPFDALRWFGG